MSESQPHNIPRISSARSAVVQSNRCAYFLITNGEGHDVYVKEGQSVRLERGQYSANFDWGRTERGCGGVQDGKYEYRLILR